MINKESDILYLLGLPDDDVFEKIGIEIFKPILHSSGKTKTTYLSAGIKWFDRRKNEFCKVIVASHLYDKLVQNEQLTNRVELVCAVADLLLTIESGYPVMLASILIVKNGFFEVCKKLLNDQQL